MNIPVPEYNLQLFGMFGCADRQGQDITPRGRKAKALAAYIALSGGKPIPRERLAALLWGQRAEEQARASLRQTFYELRQFTSGQAPMFRVEREHVQLIEGNVATDVARMRTMDNGAFARIFGNRLEELLIDLDDLDEGFDEWLKIERTRLADERSKLGLNNAERLLRAGDPTGASKLVNLFLVSDPLDDRALRLAVEAHCAVGDRSAARRLYERYESLVKEQLGVEPSPDLATFVTATLAKGDAARAANPTNSMASSPMAGEVARPTPAAWAPSRPLRMRRIGGVSTLVSALVVVMVVTLALHLYRAHARSAVRTLLVQPLQSGANDQLAKSLSHGLGEQLSQFLVGQDLDLNVRTATSASTAASGDLTLGGEASSSAGHLRVEIRLSDRKGAQLWSATFSRPAREVDELREQIATRIVGILGVAFGSHPLPSDADADTWRLFLAACDQAHGDFASRNQDLREVVGREPRFAHGWAMLAAATAFVADDEKDRASALRYAQRALELDPRDAAAYFALAMVYGNQWDKAESFIEKGLALEPDHAGLNSLKSYHLADVGRMNEALYYAERAVEVDPFAQLRTGHLIQIYAYDDRLNESGQMLTRALRRWPNSPSVLGVRFDVAARVGDPRIASAMLDDPEWLSTHDPLITAAWRAFLAARANPSAKNAASAKDAIALAAKTFTTDDDTMDFVQDLTELGQIDAAFGLWTPRRPATKYGDIWFRNYMAPLRADPRFMAIAAEQGIAQIWISSGKWPDFCSRPLPFDCMKVARSTVAQEGHPKRL